MVDQLRFTAAEPLGDWLKKASAEIEAAVPKEAWEGSEPLGVRRILIRKFLREGLVDTLRTSDLCGLQAECDEGCSPSIENTSPDRFEACRHNTGVELYGVRDDCGLNRLTEDLVGVLVKKLPGARSASETLRLKLTAWLTPHYYRNELCGTTDACAVAEAVDIKMRLTRSSEA